MKNRLKKFVNSTLNKAKDMWLPRTVRSIMKSDEYQALIKFLHRHVFLYHAIIALCTCFLMEWLSRHSFSAAFDFVVDHTGPYLFNSYVIFAILSLALLIKRRSFLRTAIFGLFLALGIVNCVILFNRVTPLGFTDLNMIGDLLTMQNTNYFTAPQAALATTAFLFFLFLLVMIYRKAPQEESKMPFPARAGISAGLIVFIPILTAVLLKADVLTSYFGNLAQGYLDYGYIYGFSTSAFDRGMKEPFGYSKSSVVKLVNSTDQGDSEITEKDGPNVIVMLLESFFDVSEADFIETSEDPIPYFHSLERDYSCGHLTVPVVGAGTCNTEFEVLTGMSCQFFGPGEYPQKTILKQTDVESIASDLKTLGYSGHVVHNNGGNFYSRANAFSMMGFDEFTSKEMLDITEMTPIGSWARDGVLIDGTKDALDSTKGKDFIYTITVEAHGDYPHERFIKNPDVTVSCRGKDEELEAQWEYYINMIHRVDQFLADYTAMLDARGEDTILIAFGDHLPTMGLTEDEVATGDLFQTKYITWNNFDMDKKDEDLTSYQLVSMYLDRLGIHDGTMINYNQAKTKAKKDPKSNSYMDGLRLLQYDLLYGDRYAYGGQELYPASDIVMGTNDIQLKKAYVYGGKLHLFGDSFTKWSKVFVNGEKVDTTYESGQRLVIDLTDVNDGDTLVVNQMGSRNTIFRSSNPYVYHTPETAAAE